MSILQITTHTHMIMLKLSRITIMYGLQCLHVVCAETLLIDYLLTHDRPQTGCAYKYLSSSL